MEKYMAAIWLGVAVISAIGEAASLSLTSIWFTGGGVAALILALVGAPIPAQVAVFLVVSAVLLAVTRPLAKRFVNGRKQATNLDRIIGMHATVTQPIENRSGAGEVYVDGKHWSARNESDSKIDQGAEVEILRIEGVKVIVRELSPSAVRSEQ